jgi:hypothetical protein
MVTLKYIKQTQEFKLRKKIESLENKYIPEPNSGCWIWIAAGYKGKFNYGQVQFNGKVIVAHRASWILYNGEIAPGLFVLHKCDNPSCVNPSHLFLGTKKDNHLDMMSKGRGEHISAPRPFQRGEKHPNAKFSDDQARFIRFLWRNGVSVKAIAECFRVKKCTVSALVHGHSYKYVN